MIPVLAYVVVILGAAGTIWGITTAVANRAPGAKQLIFAAALELVTVVQSVIGIVRLLIGFRPVEPVTTAGYLLVIVVLVPLAWFWANSERTRYSGVVLAVAALSVLGMTLRLLGLWTPAAAR